MATSNTDFATSIAIVVLFITTPPSKGSLGRKATLARDAVQVAGGVHSINTHTTRIAASQLAVHRIPNTRFRNTDKYERHPPGLRRSTVTPRVSPSGK